MTALVWLNGRLCDAREARIDPADRGFTLGDGCFDTALCIDGRLFEGDRHVARLAATCAALKLPVERAQIERAHRALAGEIRNGSIRFTVTRGPGARGLAWPAEPRTTLLGTAAPLAPAMMFKPLVLALAESRRNETSPTSRLKTLAYLDAILETDRARSGGADEPVFLNTKGRLACSALANVFVFEGERLLTPPLEDGVLDGVMRRFVLEAGGRAGLDAQIASVGASGLTERTALLTNSLRLVVPASFGGFRPFGKETAARTIRLMELVCEAIADECGEDPRDLGAAFPDLEG